MPRARLANGKLWQCPGFHFWFPLPTACSRPPAQKFFLRCICEITDADTARTVSDHLSLSGFTVRLGILIANLAEQSPFPVSSTGTPS